MGPPKSNGTSTEQNPEASKVIGRGGGNNTNNHPEINPHYQGNPNIDVFPPRSHRLSAVPKHQQEQHSIELVAAATNKRQSDLTLLRDDGSESEYWESQLIGGEEDDVLGTLPDFRQDEPDDVLGTMYDICSSYAQYPDLLVSDGIDVMDDFIADDDEFALPPDLTTPQAETVPGSAVNYGGQDGGLVDGNMSFGAFPSIMPSDIDPEGHFAPSRQPQSSRMGSLLLQTSPQEQFLRQSGGNSSTATPNSNPDLHVFQDSVKLSDSGYFMTDMTAIPPVQNLASKDAEG